MISDLKSLTADPKVYFLFTGEKCMDFVLVKVRLYIWVLVGCCVSEKTLSLSGVGDWCYSI